ncbi:tyrosine-type recombinase/integrase [Aurantiacibacter luteus]|uniref:Integrase n=1 Tax=Aurantiacibacter luteus TaxID=1581420 RepID=A0A0G9MTL2_9SPHN|nr:integrase arm-type DNA-binding domain-containing protein [Aurantiacibacter luteus]KLE34085.1 integrase [Aurantiacibacter luteus]
MALSDLQVKQASPRERDWKISDGGGLYLLVRPNGSKLWRMKYRHFGKEKKLSFGSYPEVGLKEARLRRDEARVEIGRGGDPARRKREERIAAYIRAGDTFESVAFEFIAKREAEGLAMATLVKSNWLASVLCKSIGHRPIAEITPHEMLAVLKKYERDGTYEKAKRLRSFASRVFRYAVSTLRAEHDPCSPLRGALISPKAKHYAAITDPVELGGLLRAIDVYEGYPSTRFALQISPHVFVRPGELRHAEWDEVDWEAAVWRIPAGKMKSRRPHAVPLSRQVVAILEEARGINGGSRYIFRSLHARGRPMSENTVNGALRRMGYTGDEMTAHGLRATASTLLNESGLWSHDAIERALAHQDSNVVRGIYHRGQHWEERVQMAQWWSDYLDALKRGPERSREAHANVAQVHSRLLG